jgi:hypothetical protein
MAQDQEMYVVTDFDTVIYTGSHLPTALDLWNRRRDVRKPEHQENIKIFVAKEFDPS